MWLSKFYCDTLYFQYEAEKLFLIKIKHSESSIFYLKVIQSPKLINAILVFILF